MKSKLIYGLSVLLLIGTHARADIFFADSFNRSNSTDIDASTDGMTGSLSPLTWVEAFEGSGQGSSIQIASNQLNVAVGAGMSSLFLDHNFIDEGILTSDGFSISMDVVSITTADDSANRFGGFGVGNSRAEALAAADSFDSAAPFRPSTARANQGIGVSDFYVDLALDNCLRLWSNGALLNTINVGAASGTLRVDFYVTGFNAAAPVTAVVYFNGMQKDIRSFAWDYSNTNYIGISGRTVGAGVFLDNFSIRSVTQETADIFVTAVNGSTVVKEGSTTDEISFSMTANPLSWPVTISIADALDPAQVTVSPAQVTFTSADWQTPQTVTVQAIDDNDMERAIHDTTLRLTVATDSQSPYYGYPLADIPVLIHENDCGAWGFNPADFNLDCQVNLEDFSIFALEWIHCSTPDPECQDFRP
jgi:hypothetical protein